MGWRRRWAAHADGCPDVLAAGCPDVLAAVLLLASLQPQKLVHVSVVHSAGYLDS